MLNPSRPNGLAILATVASWLAPLAPSDTTGSGLAGAKSVAAVTIHVEFRTESDAELTEWALGQFAQAGLHLPPMTVAFHDSKERCGGHPGLYQSGTPARIDICGFNWDRFIPKAKMTLLHELAHAWAAQHRLFRTYRRLTARGRPPQVAATAVARELAGFVWATLTH